MNAPLPHAPRVPLESMQLGNRYAQLPDRFHTRLAPTPLPDPHLVALSEDVATLIGLDPAEASRPEFAEVFAGNRLIRGSDPLAAVYAGHQFGSWSGRLGDGRAHLLGDLPSADGHMELQLKGAGPTPYSRFSDGRAVLRSSIREFLCSEAMAALGVPTTRALCVIGSPLPVQRERMETAAVVTRVAPSFIRFGSFEHFADGDDRDGLHTLADHVIDHFMPGLREQPEPHAALLTEVSRRTAVMVAHWQAVGFMHGVMNTDNMSALGLTLDYGPFGFMETFDAGRICNHSDTWGRYAFRAQPRIAHWNLLVLADALGPLIGHPDRTRALVDDSFQPAFDAHYVALMRSKLGFAQAFADDADLIGSTLGLLQLQHIDYPQFFRVLCELPGAPARDLRARTDAPLRDLFVDREACDAWLVGWRARLAREATDDAIRQAAMRAVNPCYVLRNWMAESAIRAAEGGNFSEVRALLDCLRRPFDERPAFTRYAAPPPDWASGLTVSCSS